MYSLVMMVALGGSAEPVGFGGRQPVFVYGYGPPPVYYETTWKFGAIVPHYYDPCPGVGFRAQDWVPPPVPQRMPPAEEKEKERKGQ
jgi:hypothetical protein